jgi:predicted outer membrane protein
MLAVTMCFVSSVAIAQDPPVAKRAPVRIDAITANAPDSQLKQSGKTVAQVIVEKLKKANEAEIEIAKMAQQKASNEEIKQLTKTIISDHEALNKELEQVSITTASEPGVQLTVPPELCEIMSQACENNLQMTKDMLSKYEGQDFQMAFLGQQAVAHGMMLAELKAINSTGPDSLTSFTETAIKKIESHLEKMKQLAKKFEKDSAGKKSNS